MAMKHTFNVVQNTSNWYEIPTDIDLSQYTLIQIAENGSAIDTASGRVEVASIDDGRYVLRAQLGLIFEEEQRDRFKFSPTVFGYAPSDTFGEAIFASHMDNSIEVLIFKDERPESTPDIPDAPTADVLTFSSVALSFQDTLLTFESASL